MQNKLFQQNCAICEKNNYKILYKANFKLNDLNEKVFSARRLPDRIHYQVVKCLGCGLIYSNPIAGHKEIEKLYKKSFTDYDEQINNLQKTYGYYLKELANYQVKKNNLLEIGCGNGFFLLEAIRQGYNNVYGVEPGAKSVAKANLKVKKNIIIDIFKPGIFQKDFFDVICCFQTFDHIPDPNSFLEECYKILKKDGFLLFLNHDAEALTAKLLGEKSPIIDIEHTYLYSNKTITKILLKHKFEVIKIESAFNIHNLAYWTRLTPLPIVIKSGINWFLELIKINSLQVKIHPGNMVIFAKK